MCGICGIRFHDRHARVDPLLIARMSARLAHRGPDDQGYDVDRNTGLGHRRLSIIDVEGGRQPIYGEDGSVVVIFNGEIYNYRELRSRLRARGHRFRTRSDTEVIVHAYEEYGDDCVHHFRGMFAFAVSDRRRERLLLARDRLGIKPLYYCESREGLAFASEVKSLLEVPGLEREIDPIALDLYLSLRYVPGPRTMLRGVRKLPPGHLLVADASGVAVRRYWELCHEPVREASDDEVRDRFAELLTEAVRLRMIADVPLGVFLSGGLDSSTILALMSTLGREPVRSFSVGYAAGSGSDERDYARLAARHLGSRHRELRLDGGELRDELPRMIWHLDEPLADPTCAPLYLLSRMARDDVTVVLSGEGADEILGGYGIYRRMAAVQAIRSRTPARALRLAALLAPLAPGEATRSWLRRGTLPLPQAYTGVGRAFRPELKAMLLGRGSGAEAAVRDALAPHYAACEGASTLERMLHLDTKVWLPDDLLLKADRMTMANSVELRVPFLDHELVELVATLPSRWKLGRGANGGKVLLRQAFGDRLPPPIVSRAKRGFPVPTGRWLRGALRSLVHETLLGEGTACSLHLDSTTIRELVHEHDTGRSDRAQELWALLVFEEWQRQFLSNQPSAAGGSTARLVAGELVANAARAVLPRAGFPPAGPPAVAAGDQGSGS